MLSIPFAPGLLQALDIPPAWNYVMDKPNMVQRKKSLPCAMHYAIIFASTVRDPPPFQSRTHSSILLLWWNPARPPKAALFLAAGAGDGALRHNGLILRVDSLAGNVLPSKTLQKLTGQVIFP